MPVSANDARRLLASISLPLLDLACPATASSLNSVRRQHPVAQALSLRISTIMATARSMSST